MFALDFSLELTARERGAINGSSVTWAGVVQMRTGREPVDLRGDEDCELRVGDRWWPAVIAGWSKESFGGVAIEVVGFGSAPPEIVAPEELAERSTADSPSSAAAAVARTDSVSIRLVAIDVVERLAKTVHDAPKNDAEQAVAAMILEGVDVLRARVETEAPDERADATLRLLKVLADDWVPLAGRLGRLGHALRDVYDAFTRPFLSAWGSNTPPRSAPTRWRRSS